MFWKSNSAPSIDAFQLENLIQNQIQFLFINVSPEAKHPLVEKAQVMVKSEVLTYIEQANQPKEHPIIVVCRNGRKSSALTNNLIKQGFINVFMLESGIKSLEKP